MSCYNSQSCIEAFQHTHSPCDGEYCGRLLDQSLSYVITAQCWRCPRGFRSDGYVCTACSDPIDTYSIFYLTFSIGVIALIQYFFIFFSEKERRNRIFFISSMVLETLISAIIMVLVLDPVGHFSINSCGVKQLADWYTLFRNPPYLTSNTGTIHCSTEAVYPLWTCVMIFYGIAVGTLVLFRTTVCHLFCGHSDKTIYFGLYLFPLMLLIQCVLGGLIYYSFPYLLICFGITLWSLNFILEIYWEHLILGYITITLGIISIVIFFYGSLYYLIFAFVFPIILLSLIYICFRVGKIISSKFN